MASRSTSANRTPYAAIEVVCAPKCCDAVLSLAGRRMLLAEAPMLPLKTCTLQDACACKFRKFADRREEGGERRAVPGYRAGVRNTWFCGEERRARGGRRADD